MYVYLFVKIWHLNLSTDRDGIPFRDLGIDRGHETDVE